jgi:hypothetical protein
MTSHIDDKGQVWERYDVVFVGDDGKFRIQIFATSFLHAELLLEDLKRTGHIAGKDEAHEV